MNKTALNKQNNKSVFCTHFWHEYQTFSVAPFPLSLLTSTPVYNVWVFWYESDTCTRLAEMWKQHLPHSSNPQVNVHYILCTPVWSSEGVWCGCGRWVRRLNKAGIYASMYDKHQTTRWASCSQACVSILFSRDRAWGTSPTPVTPFPFLHSLSASFFFFFKCRQELMQAPSYKIRTKQ